MDLWTPFAAGTRFRLVMVALVLLASLLIGLGARDLYYGLTTGNWGLGGFLGPPPTPTCR
jgi:hypothetical protein